MTTTAAPQPIGVIPKDELRYHGSYPFSDWGTIWKTIYNDLPPLAAYDVYDHCTRKTGVIPVPPLTIMTQWENKHFRIVKAEDGNVIALYRHDGTFSLIKAARETYMKWCMKKQREPNNPPFYESL